MENSELSPMDKIKREYQMLCVSLGEILLQQDGLKVRAEEIKKRIEQLNQDAVLVHNKEQAEKIKELEKKSAEPTIDE